MKNVSELYIARWSLCSSMLSRRCSTSLWRGFAFVLGEFLRNDGDVLVGRVLYSAGEEDLRNGDAEEEERVRLISSASLSSMPLGTLVRSEWEDIERAAYVPVSS